MFSLLQYAPRDTEKTSLSYLDKVCSLLKDSVEFKEMSTEYYELQCFFFCTLQCILTNVESNLGKYSTTLFSYKYLDRT